MAIRKYQNGGPYVSEAVRSIEQKRQQGIQDFQQFFQPGMLAIHDASVEADKRIAQYKKAEARANRDVRVPMAPNNIAKLQDELWRKGAFKGMKDRKGRELTYELAVDGVMGKMTKQAMANAEAMEVERVLNATRIPDHMKLTTPQEASFMGGLQNLWGMISRIGKEADKYYVPWTPELKEGEQCSTEECALYANDALRHYKDKKGRTLYTYDDIGGDAWTRLSAGKNAKMVYSGYEGMDYNPTKYSEVASNKRNWAAADNFLRNFNADTLDKSKTYLVNMYYNSSPNKQKAWEGALNGTTGTHTGNLYWDLGKNSWRISHNIHGVIHDDDFTQTLGSKNKLGYGVTAIAEAPRKTYYDYKYGGRIKKFQNAGKLPEVTVTAINPNRFEKDSQAYKFTRALNDNRTLLMQRYNLSDGEYNDFEKFAINIGQRESSLGEGKSYNLRELMPESGRRFVKAVWRGLVKGKGFSEQYNAPLSRGLTQIKYENDIQNPELAKEYSELRITDDNLQSDYDAMAKATIARAVHNRNFLNSKKGVNNYHYSNGVTIPFDSAMAMYWNRGRLTDYANPHPDNTDVGGATGYVRRFEHQKIIK